MINKDPVLGVTYISVCENRASSWALLLYKLVLKCLENYHY